MKAKVIIENGITTIILTPENKFEKDIIENINENTNDYDVKTYFNVEWNSMLGEVKGSNIEIILSKNNIKKGGENG